MTLNSWIASTDGNPFDAIELARNAIIDELHGASEIGSFVSVELFGCEVAGTEGKVNRVADGMCPGFFQRAKSGSAGLEILTHGEKDAPSPHPGPLRRGEGKDVFSRRNGNVGWHPFYGNTARK